MSYRRCAAKTCFNTHNCKPNLKFFNYPKDEESCQQWVVNSGRLDFMEKTCEQISKFVLCADHFEEDCFINPKFKTVFKRSITPIPTIFRNNLADFVPKSLQKHCEALNDELNSDQQAQPLSHIGKSCAPLIYCGDGMESYIPLYEESEQTIDINTSCVVTSTMLPTSPEHLDTSDDTEQLSEATALAGIHKMCRLCACLVYEDELLSLFLVENGQQPIVAKLNRILPEKVSEDDGLPQAVCSSCLYKLNDCDEMICSFVSADRRLRDLFLAPSHDVTHQVQVKVSQSASNESSCKLFKIVEELEAEEEENNAEGEAEEAAEEEANSTLYPSVHDTFLAKSPSPVNNTLCQEDEEVAFDGEMMGDDDDDGSRSPDDMNDDAHATVELTEIRSDLIGDTFEFVGAEDYNEPFEIHQEHGDGVHEDFVMLEGGDIEDGRHFEIGHVSTDGIELEYIDLECVCSECEERFPDRDTMLLHMVEHHAGNTVTTDETPNAGKGVYKKRQTYTCKACDKKVVGLKPFKRHIKTFHIPDENVCDFCGARFLIKSQLDSHRRIHTNDKPFSCATCNETFHYKKQLKRHKATHVKVNDDSPLVCLECNKVFATKVTLWRHKKTHTNQGNSLCFQCGKVLSNAASLRVHLRTHTTERPCLCPKCGKAYKDKVSLAKHIVTHTEEKNFACDVCGRYFYSKALVRQHSLSHSGEKPYKCDLCSTAFNRLGNLNQHKKKHTSGPGYTEPQYECVICRKRVRTELTLKYHLAKHTGEKKPFDCDVCGKRFIAADPYRVHMRLHTGERPFTCDTCGKTFRSLSTMKQHAALHEDQHPHECPFCERKFKRLQSLIVHRRTHTGEKPFACQICSRAFAQRGDMIKHTKTHLRNSFSHAVFKDSDEPFVMQIENIQEFKNSIQELVLSDSDITSEYLIDMPIVEVETEIQSNIGS